MRTAEEIYESNVEYERCDVSERLKRSILSAIITAQIEAIKGCAEKVVTSYFDGTANELTGEILSLIDQVK